MLPVNTILLVLGLTPNVSTQISPYVAVLRSSLVPISYWIDPDTASVRLGVIDSESEPLAGGVNGIALGMPMNLYAPISTDAC